MPPIYIAYRPNDADVTEQIIRRCIQTYGVHSVIVNPTDSITPETSLKHHVDNLMHAASTILIIVGQDWAGIDEYGRFKLSSADLPTYLEVKQALRSERDVFLVLVNGASLPPPNLVPDDMQAIYQLPSVSIRPQNFRADLNRLVHPPNLFDQLRYFFSLDWTQRYTYTKLPKIEPDML